MQIVKSLPSKFPILDYFEISLCFIPIKYMCRCLAVFICYICINLVNKGIHSMVKYVTNIFPFTKKLQINAKVHNIITCAYSYTCSQALNKCI